MDTWKLALLPVLFALVGLLVYRAKGRMTAERSQYVSLKAEYEATLNHLANHPLDPFARVRCLDAGRRFYAMENPDSYDQQVSSLFSPTSLLGIGKTNYRDNTAAREAKINSDIEARVGHIRVKAG